MDDLERAFREGLRDAAAKKPPLGSIDLGDLTTRPVDAFPQRRPARWLAVAAAVVLVAGIGAGAYALTGRDAVVPAVPVAPSPSSTTTRGTTGTAALSGMKWVAAEISGSAAASPGSGERPWLEFSAAAANNGRGEVLGSDGCQPLLGNFESAAGVINLTGWDRVVRPCGTPKHQQQQVQFVSALDSVTRFQTTGTGLDLLNESGVVVLRFDGVPASTIPGPEDPTSRAAPTSTRIFSPDPGAEENQVHDYPQVRYRNDSTATFETVLVKWSNGGSDSSGVDIRPGQYSGYVEMGNVQMNPYVRVAVKGAQYEYKPSSPGRELTRGNVTYVLNIVDGKLTVTPEVQD